MKKFKSDIDIDVANRDKILSIINYTPAKIYRNGKPAKHPSGVYVTDIPYDPFNETASIDYETAEQRGYIKIDFLNMSVYQQVRDSDHLDVLTNTEPDWDMLYNEEQCKNIVHLGNHYRSILRMPEPVNSIPRLAMMLSVIRPSKRHLIGLKWAEVAKTVWEKPSDDSYYFKKSHAISYAMLVQVHMNLLSGI